MGKRRGSPLARTLQLPLRTPSKLKKKGGNAFMK